MSLLLDRGADINMVGGKYGTALAAAAAFGKSVNIMSLPVLLDRGADINMLPSKYRTAFAALALSKCIDIVWYLPPVPRSQYQYSGR